MSGITGTSHVGIQVEDLDRSVAFYRDLIGLEYVDDWVRDQEYIRELVGYPGVVLHVAVLRLPDTNAFLEILEYKNVPRQAVDTGTANPGTGHLCFYVDDLDTVYARLTAAGVRSLSGVKVPTAGPNTGGKVVYMVDPDGIRVELLETKRTLAGEPRP
jgi:lactoylglutathione lyase